jgi:hypothetical protein
MANVDRRSALRKASTTDVVEALTSSATETLETPSAAPQPGPVDTTPADDAEERSVVPARASRFGYTEDQDEILNGKPRRGHLVRQTKARVVLNGVALGEVEQSNGQRAAPDSAAGSF